MKRILILLAIVAMTIAVPAIASAETAPNFETEMNYFDAMANYAGQIVIASIVGMPAIPLPLQDASISEIKALWGSGDNGPKGRESAAEETSWSDLKRRWGSGDNGPK